MIDRKRYAEDIVRDWIRWLEDKGYAPKSINVSLAALQNFLQYYQLPVSYRFIEKPPDKPLKKNDKHQWSLKEIKQFVDSATYFRDKAFMLCQFQSGMGIGDIVKLDYGDVRKELESGKLPLLLSLDRRKTGVIFKTFFGRDAVKYLKLYLKTRMPIRNRDPLFIKVGTNERVTEGAIQIMTRRLAERMDFIDEEELDEGYNPARPHSLRAAFISRLTGKMDRVLIEFFSGHNIGEERRTYLNMPDEDLRELYVNYEYLLAIERTSREEETEIANVDEETKQRLEDLENALSHVTKANQDLRTQQREWEGRVKILEEKFNSLEQIKGELRPS